MTQETILPEPERMQGSYAGSSYVYPASESSQFLDAYESAFGKPKVRPELSQDIHSVSGVKQKAAGMDSEYMPWQYDDVKFLADNTVFEDAKRANYRQLKPTVNPGISEAEWHQWKDDLEEALFWHYICHFNVDRQSFVESFPLTGRMNEEQKRKSTDLVSSLKGSWKSQSLRKTREHVESILQQLKRPGRIDDLSSLTDIQQIIGWFDNHFVEDNILDCFTWLTRFLNYRDSSTEGKAFLKS